MACLCTGSADDTLHTRLLAPPLFRLCDSDTCDAGTTASVPWHLEPRLISSACSLGITVWGLFPLTHPSSTAVYILVLYHLYTSDPSLFILTSLTMSTVDDSVTSRRLINSWWPYDVNDFAQLGCCKGTYIHFPWLILPPLMSISSSCTICIYLTLPHPVQCLCTNSTRSMLMTYS
jgi:hypothetical protein